jgi:hypothetical protein
MRVHKHNGNVHLLCVFFNQKEGKLTKNRYGTEKIYDFMYCAYIKSGIKTQKNTPLDYS